MKTSLRTFTAVALLATMVGTLFGQANHKLDPATFDKKTAACTAFQCKAGDPMVRLESDRCQIW
jgi:hypothetical protein